MNCPKCSVEMIWGSDIDVELDDSDDRICYVSHWTCPTPDCHTEVEIYYYDKPI